MATQPKDTTHWPWTVAFSRDLWVCIDTGEGFIADVTIRRNARPENAFDHALADARLIAAAPEMYEALRLLLADFEAIGAEPWHLDEARAALRKADGDE